MEYKLFPVFLDTIAGRAVFTIGLEMAVYRLPLSIQMEQSMVHFLVLKVVGSISNLLRISMRTRH